MPLQFLQPLISGSPGNRPAKLWRILIEPNGQPRIWGGSKDSKPSEGPPRVEGPRLEFGASGQARRCRHMSPDSGSRVTVDSVDTVDSENPTVCIEETCNTS